MDVSGAGDESPSPLAFRITDSGLSVYQDYSSPSGYSWNGYAEFENTGTVNLSLSDVAFAVETEDGRLVSRGGGPTVFPPVLAPGDTGYAVGEFGSVLDCPEGTTVEEEFPDVADGTTGLVLRVSAKADHVAEAPVRYGVTEGSAAFQETDGGLVMACSVENKSGAPGRGLEAALVVYGGTGMDRKAIGFAFTGIDGAGPGEIVDIEMGPVSFIDAASGVEPSEWQLYVYRKGG